MNKIFKIVFNAARGKMMVVNEATSSVQTGKKAAVTVAVIGALASGAAMAESTVLDSSKFGGEIFRTEGRHVVESATLELQNVTSTKDNLYLVGGPSVAGKAKANLVVGSAEIEAEKKYSSGVSINGAKLSGSTFVVGAGLMESDNSNYQGTAKYFGSSVELTDVDAAGAFVIGGGKVYNAGLGNLEVTNTYVNLSGNTVVNNVIGGSFVSGAKSKTTVIKTDTTNVYIGEGVTVTGKVVGGHYSNFYGKNATVNTTNVVIEGADLSKAIVIGGNYIDAGSSASALESVSGVTKTNVTVKNSIVGAIYASDYLSNLSANRKFTSTTKEANLIIENSTVKGDVIGGSYTYGANTEANVTQAISVQLSDVKVEGTITTDNVDVDADGNKQFVQNSIKGSSMALTNVEAEAVKASKGTLELRAEGEGTTTINTLTTADGVEVAFSADGAANDAADGDITKAIVITNGDYKATVNMQEGMYQGAVTGTIDSEGNVNTVQSENTVVVQSNELASLTTLSLNRVLMNDVRKRLGDLRSVEGTHGVWARYDGGKLSGASGLENDFTTIQVGIDTVPVVDAPRFGVAFAYTTSEADMTRGTADMDAFSLAFYGTKMYDNGMFVDVIGRMATADTDVVIDGWKKGSMDNVALSLSGELGWRFDVTEKFYFEPQAELTYTYVNADTLALSDKSSYEYDSVDSLVGRVGFAAGFKCPNNFGDVYVRASAVHEFLGDTKITLGNGDSMPEVDGEDTWVEFGLGANFNINKNAYVYVDIESTEGAKLEEDWRANVGVRFAF